uniref:Threonine rich-like protein n=1 Tax=Schyzocotyle acheilognathi TaxID=135513 RepID=Q5VKI6_SCHAC|nr:threonine rich-like protein precursor [Schyzocotyle acheilognathi]
MLLWTSCLLALFCLASAQISELDVQIPDGHDSNFNVTSSVVLEFKIGTNNIPRCPKEGEICVEIPVEYKIKFGPNTAAKVTQKLTLTGPGGATPATKVFDLVTSGGTPETSITLITNGGKTHLPTTDIVVPWVPKTVELTETSQSPIVIALAAGSSPNANQYWPTTTQSAGKVTIEIPAAKTTAVTAEAGTLKVNFKPVPCSAVFVQMGVLCMGMLWMHVL